jgi:hypothetical protein
MRAPYPPHTVERCRMLVTTTLLPNEDIASQTDTSEATVRRWTRIFEWKRPEAVEPGRRRIPADKYPAVRRIYACGARSEGIALLARCSVAQLDKIAAHEGWTRDGATGKPPPINPALSEASAAVETALCDPDLASPDFMRLLDRALALTAAAALAGAPDVERTAQTLTRIASVASKICDMGLE